MFRAGLTSLDWMVLGLYGVGMLVLGAYYARRQHSSDDFFVGGRSLNSTASVIITDFICRFNLRSHALEEDLRLLRILTLTMGFVIVSLAMVVQNVPGNI